MKQTKIGIVVGANNEQGYHAIVQAINEPLFLEICTPILFGSSAAASKAKEQIQVDEERQILPANYIKSAKDAIDGRINIIAGYEQRYESLGAAANAYINNSIEAIAIVPQDNAKGFDYKAAVEDSAKAIEVETNEALTWRINGNVRVLHVNGMCDIPTVVKALRKDFLFIKPKIAVMSKDETLHEQFKALREQGYMVFGPFDPDKVVDEGTYKPYDCLIFPDNENAVKKLFDTMDPVFTYHHISGMPMVMTAPTNNNDMSSLMQSIYAAIDINMSRRKYRQATRSPLEKQWVPRGRDDYKLELNKDEEE